MPDRLLKTGQLSVDSRRTMDIEIASRHDGPDEQPYPLRIPDPPGRAIEAALATTTDDRAWALVRLAADSRVLGDIETAFVALDTAWGLRPSREPARAMFSCAMACHCDRADYELAHVVASEQPHAYHDLKFARSVSALLDAAPGNGRRAVGDRTEVLMADRRSVHRQWRRPGAVDRCVMPRLRLDDVTVIDHGGVRGSDDAQHPRGLRP